MNLWQEVIKPDGSSSLQQHTPKTIGSYCKFEDHIVGDVFPDTRIATCTKCGQEIPLVLGFHEIKNNRILTVALKR